MPKSIFIFYPPKLLCINKYLDAINEITSREIPLLELTGTDFKKSNKKVKTSEIDKTNIAQKKNGSIVKNKSVKRRSTKSSSKRKSEDHSISNVGSINLKNSSVLMKGPALIDYFESKLGQKKKMEIIINNCLDAHFFMPLLYKSSPKIFFSKLIYLNSNDKKTICLFKKNLMQTGLSSNEIAIEKKQVKIIMSSKADLFFLEKVLLFLL